ncbi:MAG: hypothetical protein ACOH1K_03675 [Rhodoglobus sp.]
MSIDDALPLRRERKRRTRMSPSRAIALALAGVLIVGASSGALWAVTHQQRITDQFVVWQFEPSESLQEYVNASGMSDEGKFLFYASEPTIQTNPTFNDTCSNVEKDFGVLGCYFPGQKTIYLFDVTDDRLAGIEEVVAAHEMLHAAWDRLSDDERARITPLLEAEATILSGDADFAKTLEFYAKTEPGQRANELHSIIGTEAAGLSPSLEAYYASYFADRTSVVTLHEKSNAVFTAQQDASQKIVDELGTLRASIDTNYASYNSGYDLLNADIESFNTRANDGSFTSNQQFRNERAQLISRQDDLNANYASISADVAHYDDLVTQLDALNATISELNRSINIEPRSDTGVEG